MKLKASIHEKRAGISGRSTFSAGDLPPHDELNMVDVTDETAPDQDEVARIRRHLDRIPLMRLLNERGAEA